MSNGRRKLYAWIAPAMRRQWAKFGAMLVAIFIAELGMMLAADRMQLELSWAWALIDAALLTAVAAVIMWPLNIKPLYLALAAEHAKAQAILDAASDAIITTDDHGIIRSQNRAAQTMFGVAERDAIGRNVSSIIPPPHREQHDRYLQRYRRTGEKRMIGTTQQLDAMRSGGEIFPIELSISEVRAGNERLFTAIIRDITERKRLDDKIQNMAHYDQLTGLASRALFHDRLSQAVAAARRRRGSFGLLYLDLDRFKPVNDNYGHAAGDMLLCAVAARLRQAMRESDTVARLGGDEFALILADIGSRAAAEAVAEKLTLSLDRPYPLDDVIVAVGASIGIAVFPDDAAFGEDLVKQADHDMYRRKEVRRTDVPRD